MIPADIPKELQGLRWLEQIAISHLIPVQTIYYLKYNGATASKGHCVFIPNNVQRVANVLPNMDCDVIVLKPIGFNISRKEEFQIRVEKVRSALVWLKANNPLYADIEISEDINFTDFIRVIEYQPNAAELAQQPHDGNDNLDFDENIFIPDTKIEDQNLVNEILNHQEARRRPVSEYKTPGIFAKSFPTLFPTGVGDMTLFEKMVS